MHPVYQPRATLLTFYLTPASPLRHTLPMNGALLTAAHAITRATVEMWTFDHGEDCDYRVTFGAALRMLHQWRKRFNLTISDAWAYRRGSAERIVFTANGRQFEIDAHTLASRGDSGLCEQWRAIVIPVSTWSVQHPTEVEASGFPVAVAAHWISPEFWRRILRARGAIEPKGLDAVYALYGRGRQGYP